jgi:hypothetical protein
MSRYEWEIATAQLTKEQREALDARVQLQAALKELDETKAKLRELRELFKLGWREGEAQWRVTAEVALRYGVKP